MLGAVLSLVLLCPAQGSGGHGLGEASRAPVEEISRQGGQGALRRFQMSALESDGRAPVADQIGG